MPKAQDMEGKAALVTGAASGLGRATALALARAGADVLLVDVNGQALEQAAVEVKALGVRGEAYAGDLADVETCREAVARAVAAFGRLDALCCVAGIVAFVHSEEMEPAAWNKILAVNLNAPFFLFQAAIPHLLKTEGAVVNVTSASATVIQAYTAAYSTSKAGLEHLTRALALEYVHTPVRINAIAPGGMKTGMPATIRMPENVDFSLVHNPPRGMVEIDHVAEFIAYLASPAAEGFHGVCIHMDRGLMGG